ncbi:MAG: HAMP domain-containing histidine kinase [Lactobacillaceae bacterium]|jgi:two-component system sensor histidine kinase CiaH|nr:HAMP domain-containing histidine kinase [Lactobacillaceae bacterium]
MRQFKQRIFAKLARQMRILNFKMKRLRLVKWLIKLRLAMSTQMKMIILTVVGFTLVFVGIGTFVINQVSNIIYVEATERVQQPFMPDRDPNGFNSAQVTTYSKTLKKELKLPNESQPYIKYFNRSWMMFMYQGDKLAYQNIDSEHQVVEMATNRLLLIFMMSEIALLAMAIALSRANMVPVMRSWKQQRTFVADAAHEFKTPMTVIQNNLERMLEHPNDTVMEQVEGVANSLTEVRHLNSLTNDLLTLAQADADVILFQFEEMDLAVVAQEVHDILSYNAAEYDQKLEIKVPAQALMVGDAQRLRQLLVILTDNAQKYAGPAATVTVDITPTNKAMKIMVIDTGVGVSDREKAHLFDRFFRIDKARSRESGGHGLGLSIAKWIVEGHHGTIEVVDTKPHGTTFKISIPLKQ